MLNKFFPRSAIFFDLLDKHALLCLQAAKEFQESLSEKIDHSALKQIKILEHEADSIARQIAETLHKTFITPIDRDLIYQLVSKLDDVIDSVDATADCLIIYRINEPTADLIKLADILFKAVLEVKNGVNGLRNLKESEHIKKACIGINRFEHDADDGLRFALETLFDHEPNARQLIIWKEIYETLESATDRCSDVADTIEGILLEND